MGKTRTSPAMELMLLVHTQQGYQQGRSRERTAHGMHAAARLAIGFGLRFNEGDFAKLAEQKPSYYDTSVYRASETDYALACGCQRGLGNTSAALAYEYWKNRKPFLICDRWTKTPTRVYIGREFPWDGRMVRCTSFAEDGESFTACSYKPRESDEDYSNKIDRRYTIDHKAIAAARRAEREQLKQEQEPAAAA